MKIFVVPDVHLKTWMFDRASELISQNEIDKVIVLGDVFDDWSAELSDYTALAHRAIAFARTHDVVWCLGNHDLAYWLNAPCSGNMLGAYHTVMEFIHDLYNTKGCEVVVGKYIDGYLFSHAGFTENFVKKYGLFFNTTDNIYKSLDKMSQSVLAYGVRTRSSFWTDDSPFWARPNHKFFFNKHIKKQVVGHTPVADVIEQDGLIVTDTFSTEPSGRPIGNQNFVIIDTETNEMRCIR